MKYGFTGTQNGMTDYQKAGLILVVRFGRPSEFHHGDCIGADEEAVEIVHNVDYGADCGRAHIISHPPKNPKKRAYAQSDVTCKPEEYLERNQDIVDVIDVLIAAPYTMEEVLRSGTWATIRYAEKRGIPVIKLLPVDRR